MASPQHNTMCWEPLTVDLTPPSWEIGLQQCRLLFCLYNREVLYLHMLGAVLVELLRVIVSPGECQVNHQSYLQAQEV